MVEQIQKGEKNITYEEVHTYNWQEKPKIFEYFSIFMITWQSGKIEREKRLNGERNRMKLKQNEIEKPNDTKWNWKIKWHKMKLKNQMTPQKKI